MILPVTGAMLGCAVGDAIGLPYEGLTKQRGVRLLGAPDHHRFVFGRGMVSDDTEHTCLVAQALCEAPTDPDLFARKLAARLRWWLAGLPAGIGLGAIPTRRLRSSEPSWVVASDELESPRNG